MSKILKTHPKSVQSHKDLILQCLDDKDESIRLRALDLLYGMVWSNVNSFIYCTRLCFIYSNRDVFKCLSLYSFKKILLHVIWQFSWCLVSRYRKRTWWRSWRNWCSMLTKQKELLIETNSSPRSSTSAARATTSISPTLSGQSPHSILILWFFKDPAFILPHIFRVFWQVYKHPGGTDAVRGHPAWPSHCFSDARCSDSGQSHPGLCSCSDGHSARQCPPFNRQHAANGHLWSAVCCSLDLWWILRVSPFLDAASVKPERG